MSPGHHKWKIPASGGPTSGEQVIGAAHYLDTRFDEAIRWMEKAVAANPSARWIHRQLVPAYSDAGRDEDAKDSLRLLLEGYPDMTCEEVRAAMLYSGPVMERIFAGLLRAGMPAKR